MTMVSGPNGSTRSNRAPDLMPVLSTGRHRHARKGACFMEMASYLAGERWSDHPACTHSLLAAVAREVNDHVSDRARPRIAPLIPDVVGLRSGDPLASVWIARAVALTAIPIAPAPRQRVLAVGLLSCERLLADAEGQPVDHLGPAVRAALESQPDAYAWARRTTLACGTGNLKAFVRRGAPSVVHSAVSSIAEAAVNDTDERLVALLEWLVPQCREWFGVQTEAPAMSLPEGLEV